MSIGQSWDMECLYAYRQITRDLLGSKEEDQNNFSRLEEAKFASSLGGPCGHLLVICPFLSRFFHFILLGYLIQQLSMV